MQKKADSIYGKGENHCRDRNTIPDTVFSLATA